LNCEDGFNSNEENEDEDNEDEDRCRQIGPSINLNANVIAQGGIYPDYYQLKDINVSMDSEDDINLNLVEVLNKKFNKTKDKKNFYQDIQCKQSVFCLTKKNKLR